MPLNYPPLGYTGEVQTFAAEPQVKEGISRAATATEAAAGTRTDLFISPATMASGSIANLASPPPIGSTAPNTGSFTTLTLAPTTGTAGASPRVVNNRSGVAEFSSVSIAGGAIQTLVITNSAITGASTLILFSLIGADTGAALTIKSYTPSAGSVSVVVTNGTGASTTTTNIKLQFLVLN